MTQPTTVAGVAKLLHHYVDVVAHGGLFADPPDEVWSSFRVPLGNHVGAPGDAWCSFEDALIPWTLAALERLAPAA